jgi:hypothetical protein
MTAAMRRHAAVDRPTGNSAADRASGGAKQAMAEDRTANERAADTAGNEACGSARTAADFVRIMRAAVVMMAARRSVGRDRERGRRRRRERNGHCEFSDVFHFCIPQVELGFATITVVAPTGFHKPVGYVEPWPSRDTLTKSRDELMRALVHSWENQLS